MMPKKFIVMEDGTAKLNREEKQFTWRLNSYEKWTRDIKTVMEKGSGRPSDKKKTSKWKISTPVY